jgi:hypothetical protein
MNIELRYPIDDLRVASAGDRARHGRRFPRPRGKPARTRIFQTFLSVMPVTKLDSPVLTAASELRALRSEPRAPKSETRSPHSRPALVAILEQFYISVPSFDGLRSDAYEKHIAAGSLIELEGFYRMLMEPYGSYKEKQKLCPVWNKGGKSGDKLPDARTLSRIKHRIMAEHVAVELAVGGLVGPGWYNPI